MRPGAFLLQVVLCLLCIVGVNVLMERFVKNATPRRRVRLIDQSPPVTDLFVGSSLIEVGILVEEFQKARPASTALNIGLSSTCAVEHNLLLRKAIELRPDAVYYGFMDDQLTESPSAKWEDLFGNRAMVYYINPDIAITYLGQDSLLNQVGFRLTSWIPMLFHRHTLWAKVERVRRRLDEIGMPHQATTRFGRTKDITFLEPKNEKEFARYCQEAVDRQYGLISPIKDMLTLVREQGGQMIVVEMPMRSDRRKRYYSTPEWRAYLQHLRQLTAGEKAQYVDASDWVPDDGFDDSIHLSKDGARLFTQKLAARAPSPRGKPSQP